MLRIRNASKGKNQAKDKVVKRELCSILSRGTRTYCFLDDVSSAPDGSPRSVNMILSITVSVCPAARLVLELTPLVKSKAPEWLLSDKRPCLFDACPMRREPAASLCNAPSGSSVLIEFGLALEVREHRRSPGRNSTTC